MAMRRIALALVAFIVAGCAVVPVQSEARARDPEGVPYELLDPTTTTTIAGDAVINYEATVWMFDQENEVLVQAVRTLPEPRTDRSTLYSLFETSLTEDETDLGRVNNLPPTTDLLSVNPEGNIATVDLSDAFGGATGNILTKAYAQIVYTLTEGESIDRVLFRIAGEPRPIDVADGSSLDRPVSRADFVQFTQEFISEQAERDATSTTTTVVPTTTSTTPPTTAPTSGTGTPTSGDEDDSQPPSTEAGSTTTTTSG